MHAILDNLGATVIAGMLLLLLLLVSFRNQEVTVESSDLYTLNRQMLDLHDVLKRDLQNASQIVTTTEQDSTFTFFAQTDPDDTTKFRVVYKRVYTGIQQGDSLYRIERYVEDVLTSSSSNQVRMWIIRALDETNTVPLDPLDARQVYVFFEMVPPFQTTAETPSALQEARWESTIRPELLQNVLM
jgi:hypothetical protein